MAIITEVRLVVPPLPPAATAVDTALSVDKLFAAASLLALMLKTLVAILESLATMDTMFDAAKVEIAYCVNFEVEMLSLLVLILR